MVNGWFYDSSCQISLKSIETKCGFESIFKNVCEINSNIKAGVLHNTRLGVCYYDSKNDISYSSIPFFEEMNIHTVKHCKFYFQKLKWGYWVNPKHKQTKKNQRQQYF